MKITKFGHSCLLIEDGGIRVLIDPGNYCEKPEVSGLDAILITHEHSDHCHPPFIKEILAENANAKVVTQSGAGKILTENRIDWVEIKTGETIKIKNLPVTSFGETHARIHEEIPLIKNTSFMVGERFFYPGDSLFAPEVEVEILALPVSAPWLKLEEAIEYARKVHPKIVFPVHDGMLCQDHRLGPTRRIPEVILSPLKIKYIDMREGSVMEF